jgi:hypothetical protein
MKDRELADEIIARLNKLIEHPDIRRDVAALIEQRVTCSQVTYEHPTIQASSALLGFLGLLNGLVGADPELKDTRVGWGYITACYDEAAELVRFELTKNK